MILDQGNSFGNIEPERITCNETYRIDMNTCSTAPIHGMDTIIPKHVILKLLHHLSYDEQIDMLSQINIDITNVTPIDNSNNELHCYLISKLGSLHFYNISDTCIICDIQYPYTIVHRPGKLTASFQISPKYIEMIDYVDISVENGYLSSESRRAIFDMCIKYNGNVLCGNIIIPTDDELIHVIDDIHDMDQHPYMSMLSNKRNYTPKRLRMKVNSIRHDNIRIVCKYDSIELFNWSLDFLDDLGCVTTNGNWISIEFPVEYKVLQHLNKQKCICVEIQDINKIITYYVISYVESEYPSSVSSKQSHNQFVETTQIFNIVDPIPVSRLQNIYEVHVPFSNISKGYIIRGNIDKLTSISLRCNGILRFYYDLPMISLYCQKLGKHSLYISLGGDKLATFNDISSNKKLYINGLSSGRLEDMKFTLTYSDPEPSIEILSCCSLNIKY